MFKLFTRKRKPVVETPRHTVKVQAMGGPLDGQMIDYIYEGTLPDLTVPVQPSEEVDVTSFNPSSQFRKYLFSKTYRPVLRLEYVDDQKPAPPDKAFSKGFSSGFGGGNEQR